MKYFLPVGGITDMRFGILTSPKHKGIPSGIVAGMSWAADNGAFTRVFDPNKYLDWMETMLPYRDTCLFVTCPDALGNATETLRLFEEYKRELAGWPVAFVAQDGMENHPLPDGFDVLFIGGSTRWKDGPGAVKCIGRAIFAGKGIHIGRVNYWKRYDKFSQLEKETGKEFTCDGTKNRFIGLEKAIRSYIAYHERSRRQDGFDLSISNSDG